MAFTIRTNTMTIATTTGTTILGMNTGRKVIKALVIPKGLASVPEEETTMTGIRRMNIPEAMYKITGALVNTVRVN